MKITSVNNELVKETAKLLKTKYREETGLFLIEGEKGVQEAIDAKLEVQQIFVLENTGLFNLENNVIETTEAVLSKISDAKTSPKVVAVVKQPVVDVNVVKTAQKVLLLEGIKDAGNLGTILRTSVAFGVDLIVLYGDTVDLYNPKCVRSTVGNLWKVPVLKIKNIDFLKGAFNEFQRIATLPNGDNVINLKEFKSDKKQLIMFGSEADGLTEELKFFATDNLTIEMNNNVESLNLAVSVAIVLYKIFV